MKLRWFIEYNGDMKLQYLDECGCWISIDIVFERELEWRENTRLKERVKELENDICILSEVKK